MTNAESAIPKGAPWYVVITCDAPSIVVGPYPTQADAEDEAQSDAGLIFGLITIDAKTEGYVVDDVFWTQQPPTDSDVIRILPD